MEKNNIFNANLLQLPLKAQVADEGMVQDIAPVAEPTAPAMGEGLVLDTLNEVGEPELLIRCVTDETVEEVYQRASNYDFDELCAGNVPS